MSNTIASGQGAPSASEYGVTAQDLAAMQPGEIDATQQGWANAKDPLEVVNKFDAMVNEAANPHGVSSIRKQNEEQQRKAEAEP